jgi:hypothetical protein
MCQATAAWFFPRETLVKNIDGMTSARQLLAAHRAGRSPADDRNVCHLVSF